MSTDWREKEREFLASLEADTGRDLAAWMALIAAQQLPHRNDIIDWLRRQGFMFSRASWLERIHHNGGQPIYLEAGALAGATGTSEPPSVEKSTPTMPAAEALTAPADTPPSTVTPAPAPPAASRTGPPSAVPPPQPNADPARPATARTVVAPPASAPPAATPEVVAETLAKAKAYRPLAQLVLRKIETELPGLTVSAGASHLVLSRPLPFALLAVSGKDIRLALALGEQPIAAPFEPVRLPVTSVRAAGPLTHMIVLTDARQVDAALIALVGQAAGIANP